MGEIKSALTELTEEKVGEVENIKAMFKIARSEKEGEIVLFWCITKEGDDVCDGLIDDLKERRKKKDK